MFASSYPGPEFTNKWHFLFSSVTTREHWLRADKTVKRECVCLACVRSQVKFPAQRGLKNKNKKTEQ